MTKDEERDVLDRMQRISNKTLIYLFSIAFGAAVWATKLQLDVTAIDGRITSIFSAHEAKDAQTYLRVDSKIEDLAHRNDRTDRLLEDISKRLDEIYKLMMNKHGQ